MSGRELRAWCEVNGIRIKRHYEGLRFFRPGAHGYALGSVVIARPRTDGTLWVEVLPKSVWNRATACWECSAYTAPSLQAALAGLRAE